MTQDLLKIETAFCAGFVAGFSGKRPASTEKAYADGYSWGEDAQEDEVDDAEDAAYDAWKQYSVREMASRQAWGEALAASTDANGRIDYPAAAARLARWLRGQTEG